MAKKTKDSNLSIEERLEQALIPNWDEPYKLPENWCWLKLLSAFENCTSLESIVIPAAVKKIGDNAFRNCSKLKNIQFEITDGWQCFDVNTPMTEVLNLSDTEQNATYLTFRYNQYKWKRQ